MHQNGLKCFIKEIKYIPQLLFAFYKVSGSQIERATGSKQKSSQRIPLSCVYYKIILKKEADNCPQKKSPSIDLDPVADLGF
jgi:hypothetical protein